MMRRGQEGTASAPRSSGRPSRGLHSGAREEPSALGILFVVVFVDLLGFGMVIPVMPLYAERLGASAAWTGLLSTGYSAMQFVFTPIWGASRDRMAAARCSSPPS